MTTPSPLKLRPLGWVSLMLRLLASLLEQWPMLLLAAFLISPIGPHLRLEYEYQQFGNYKRMNRCTYIGNRGLVDYIPVTHECPLIQIMESSQEEKP